MSLILVVEPDSRHAAQLASIARNHLHAELVMAESGDRAVAALDHRVPDIVLTAPLLPHRDEAVLSDYLRALGDAGAHVQTLTIPIFSMPAAAHRGVRGMFRKERANPVMPVGCDPALFAEQVGQYLHRARQRQVATAAPPAPAIAFRETPTEPLLAREVVSGQEADDVDLTPFLQDISEPADHYDLQAEPAERFDASGGFEPVESMPTFEAAQPVAHVEPVYRAEPMPAYEADEPVARYEPMYRAEPTPTFEAVEPVDPRELIRSVAPTEPEPIELEPIEPIEPIQSPRLFAEPIQAAPPVARVVPSAPVRRVEPVAPAARVEPAARVDDVEPVQPAEPIERREAFEPRREQAIRAVEEEPRTSYAEAPSRAELLPALAAPLARRRERRPEPAQVPAVVPQPVLVPQLITVPTGDGSSQTSVSIAVAVSVQVATHTTVSSAPKRGATGQPKPVQDEWGFFDPDQCGFRALLARLDAIAAHDDED